jgi:hypothetical protein
MLGELSQLTAKCQVVRIDHTTDISRNIRAHPTDIIQNIRAGNERKKYTIPESRPGIAAIATCLDLELRHYGSTTALNARCYDATHALLKMCQLPPAFLHARRSLPVQSQFRFPRAVRLQLLRPQFRTYFSNPQQRSQQLWRRWEGSL